MRPRVGFVMEQALGHVAYAIAMKHALAGRTDLEPVWLDVPFPAGAIGKVPVLGTNWTVRGSLRARRAIARAHAERPLDALFVHTQTISLFSGDLMARIPTLLSLDATPLNYDELTPWYGDRVHPEPVERAKLLAHRAVMRRVKKFTTWSEWAKCSLVKDYGAPAADVTVLYPGTTLSNFAPTGPRPERRSGPLRILFVGGDFVRKGGDLLLDVFRTSLFRTSELHLVTGADIAPGKGVFVYKGLKPHSPELLRRFAEADVFVLPTRGDCLAVVLGEAMASSLPIITTRVGAHPEAVVDGESGFVLAKDDGEALRDRLERLAADPALAPRMGQKSRQIGEERFDMNKNANRIADMLVDLGRPSASRRAA
jgi:glycosyltransferase involved in cell wall biosynthesis